MNTLILKYTTTVSTLALCLSIFLVGCHKGSGSKTPAPEAAENMSPANSNPQLSDKTVESNSAAGEFSYWYIRNGCSTEKQTFPSKDALCKGLQDKTLNKICALELRQKRFEKESCSGEFAEFTAAESSAASSSPKPIRCVGRVSGSSGTKMIDETIQWDRKTFQKVILSSFTDVKDAGEYSLNLLPADDVESVPAIRLFGWFIDNNKVQKVETRINSQLVFRHKDLTLNYRDVEITCGVVDADVKKTTYSAKEIMKVTCLGSFGPIQGQKDAISMLIEWNPKKPLTQDLMIEKDGKKIPSGIKLSFGPMQADGSANLRAQTSNLDGHVQMLSESKGGIDLSVEYMSAWDNRQFSFTCLPTKVWNESIQKLSDNQESKKDENK